MSYQRANVLSAAMFALGIAASLTLYAFDEMDAVFIAIQLLSALLVISGIAVKVIFYRCPHCRRGLPLRAFKPDYCPRCGERLIP